MKYIVSLLIFLSAFSLNAQIELNQLNYGGGGKYTDLMAVINPSNIKGSPLGFDEWRKGRFVVVGGDTSTYFLINYHTEKDQLYLKKIGTEEIFETNEDLIEVLLLENFEGEVETFVKVDWHSFKRFPDYSKYCQQLIMKKNFQLIKYRDKVLERPDMKQDSYSGPKIEEYVLKERYFWRNSDRQPYEEISLSRSSLKLIFSETQEERMKQYLKKNRVKWNRETEVLQMLEAIL